MKGWSFIILPIKVGAKNAIVNVQNTDRKFLQYAFVLSKIKNQQGVSKYVPYADKLDFTGIQIPVLIKYTEEFDFYCKIHGTQRTETPA